MKRIAILSLSLSCLLIACPNEDSNQQEKIAGTWTLVALEKDGAAVELTECDQKTLWGFTTEKADPLSDGTEVMKIAAAAPEDCQFYGFDSKWTVKDGSLFISSTRVGGMGGFSHAGLFEIVEQTPNALVIEFAGTKYTFER